MTEFEVIEAVGVQKFNELLAEKIKEGWSPWMTHVSHLDRDLNSVYSITIMRTHAIG